MLRWSLALAAVLPAAGIQPPAPDAPEPRPVQLSDLPPAQRLGARIEAVRRQLPVIPAVVIAEDAPSYVEAIARWSLEARYPVLLDDGTDRAREDIARFVRGFRPARVVRFSLKAEGAHAPLPDAPDARRSALENAAARAWGADGAATLAQRWAEIRFQPPGVVVASDRDPAWTAALALAAGRGQPLVWMTSSVPDGGVGGAMDSGAGESLALAVERACESTGLAWRELGDVLDAVTLCVAVPGKVRSGTDGVVATTDLVGRLSGSDGAGRLNGARWAWAGQVFGSEAHAAYSAACALFLMPREAWLFDGYPDHEPWSTWDCSKAADILRAGSMTAEIDDTPRQGLPAWEFRASRTLDAGLVFINSKGNADFFDLEPGRARPGDAPILGVPAFVHFVHSWSATSPADRDTVAGRWLERGAYAYAGSVHEPFLQAFVPTPSAAARLLSLFPWGAAVRMDQGPAWRVTVLGDPLITLGPGAPRAERDLPLEALVDLEQQMRDAAGERRFADAVHALVLLGRDEDAARLALGVLREQPGNFAPDLARAAVLPVFRAGGPDRAGSLVRIYQHLPADAAADPVLRDALWLACLPGLAAARDETMISTLRTNLRPGQVGRDAAALAPALSALFGRDVAASMLNDARRAARLHVDRETIDAAQQRLAGGR